MPTIPKHVRSGMQDGTGCRHEGNNTTTEIGDGAKAEQKEKIKTVVDTEDQINRAPVGSSNHRIWKCQAEPLEGARAKWSREVDRKTEASCAVVGHLAWERGLVPKPSPPRKAIVASDSFRWIIRPEGDMFHNKIYPDGSALDGPNPELMRCGWAFVFICPETGELIASAMGVPPPWITGIGGAEAWAMLQAALRVMPGKRSRFKGDCKACIDMVHSGLEVATSHKRALARVYGLLLPALEDTCLSCILWMPAHKSAAHVGKLRLSNGEFLTKDDVKANDMADGFAKEAVEEHRVAKVEFEQWLNLESSSPRAQMDWKVSEPLVQH